MTTIEDALRAAEKPNSLGLISIEGRKKLQLHLNKYLEEIEKLIEIADHLRQNNQRKEADNVLKLVDSMIQNYKSLDAVLSELPKVNS